MPFSRRQRRKFPKVRESREDEVYLGWDFPRHGNYKLLQLATKGEEAETTCTAGNTSSQLRSTRDRVRITNVIVPELRSGLVVNGGTVSRFHPTGYSLISENGSDEFLTTSITPFSRQTARAPRRCAGAVFETESAHDSR
ncbi:hypothetical protein EVAR_83406_1 [Eumeta japonica]|uniref:Uncharacterized protein n=1 Tax=Eumeta variegata TaxID=151549 RepID=A0A4C1TYE1_EUMVA|nr:hypothetical protein EVAR_83406_1 [Eumeta japonica]